ncbi:hypothetical protein IWQ60_010748 [Tieghemiomyces parasiticus]|uniref:MMS19 nucleotide excision repair protein n=1 Tax=Tieghemiomyces parasiticus TaxID=78921 RepID=A0A9W8DN51_9FUNG|nr:hypothetical protein IWQ60_010748 [Tieghemiomyces parasiticus]
MDSRLIESYLDALASSQDTAGQGAALEEILTSITQGPDSLLTLVQGLESALTGDDASRRAKGVKLLATVIPRLDPPHAPPAALAFLVNFFCERLSDTPCVPWLLEGLHNVTRAPGFDSTAHANRIVGALLGDLHIQSYQQATRHTAFKLLQALLTDAYLATVRQSPSTAADLVPQFIQAMDSEKDPRNLMICFDLFPRVVEALADTTDHTEDLFEVVFCYFPITFKPPPGDALGITADDLKSALRRCITATPAFGPFAVDPLIDKLASSSGTAKLDALQTLGEAARVFALADFQPHLAELFGLVREEVSQSSDGARQLEGLRTLAALFAKLAEGRDPRTLLSSSDVATDRPTPYEALTPLIDDFIVQVGDAQWTKAVDSSRLLKGVTQSCLYNAILVCRLILPVLLTTHSQNLADSTAGPTISSTLTGTDEEDSDRARVEILRNLLDGTTTALRNIQNEAPTPVDEASLRAFWQPYTEDIYHLLASFAHRFATRGPADATLACGALLVAAVLPHAFDTTEIQGAFLVMHEVYLVAGPVPRPELLACLHRLAKVHPEPVRDVTLDLYRPRMEPVQHASQLSPVLDLGLELLRKLGTVDQLARPYLEQLLVPSLHALPATYPLPTGGDVYARAVLETVQTLIGALILPGRDAAWAGELLLPALLCAAVRPTYQMTTEVSTRSTLDVPVSVFGNQDTSEALAGCIADMTRALPADQQTPILAAIYRLYVDGDVGLFASLSIGDSETAPKDVTTVAFDPLGLRNATVPEALRPHQRRSLIFFAAVYASLYPEVTLPEHQPPLDLLATLLDRALHDTMGHYGDSPAICVASWLNKGPSAALDQFLHESLPAVTGQCENRDLPHPVRRAALTVYLWATKAVVQLARRDAHQTALVDRLVAWLADTEDTELASAVAAGFGLLIRDHPFALTRAAHARVKLLYRQKFFSQCLPGLIAGYRRQHTSSDTPSTDASPLTPADPRPHYLLALSHMLPHVPKPVLMADLPALMPLLLSSLTVPEPELRIGTTNTLYVVALDAPQLVAQHLGTVVRSLLALTHARDPHNPMGVRTAALKCLAVLPQTLDYEVIHPYKDETLRALRGPLDDKKRLVRKEAVVCRNRWFTAAG